MKIKIIDLLNKSANGESLPLKIKYGGYEFQYDIINNCYVDKNDLMLEDHVNFFNKINDEIEIIEENNSFTGVKFFSNGNCFFGADTSGELKPKDGVVVDSKIEKIDINRMLQTKKWKRDKNAWDKINELIDEVNKLKENK